MSGTLARNPILTLFVVAAAGYVVGRVRVGGFSLGVAGVLFAGIALGAVDARLSVPEVLWELGLAVFVYTTGLAAGPRFLANLRRDGLRMNLLAIGTIATAAAFTAALALGGRLGAGTGAGFFTGLLTNTPALAAVLESLRRGGTIATDPVVAYSLAYPASVLAGLVAITLAQRRWRVDYHGEAVAAGYGAEAGEELVTRAVVVSRAVTVAEVVEAGEEQVRVGRVSHAGRLAVAHPHTALVPGDLVTLVGSPPAVTAATERLGEPTDVPLTADRRALDFRRIFVSDPALAGRRIGDLDLEDRFGASVTRIRRGDADLLATADAILELGDRVRVIAPPDRMGEVGRFFGDSYRALGEVDVTTFSVGIAAGVLLGTAPIPLPGGSSFTLGFAGGPLLAGLVLGALGRTGRLVWQMPYSANLTLRQFGLVLFLAGIGTRSGPAFADKVAHGNGLALVGASFALSMVLALGTMWTARRLMRLPMGLATGLVAAANTQPATLVFASEHSRDDLPQLAYGSVFPLATVAKIVVAQLLLVLLR